jgi:hypothetical protein
MELLHGPHVGQHVLLLLEPNRSWRVHPCIAADNSWFALCLQQIGEWPRLRDHRMCNDYGNRVPYSAYLEAFSHLKIRLFAQGGPPNLEPRDDIWPTDVAPIIRAPMLEGEAPAFTMLTCEPGPDVAPIHNRQIVVLDRSEWAAGITLCPKDPVS